MKRPVDICVISDVHLGTIGCRALELAQYLNSIQPKTLILNGDFVDMWNFRKYYWPETHMLVLKSILNHVAAGVQVYYLTGNHDENLRKISDLHLGNLHIKDKLVLNMDGKKAWIFHGDVFDMSVNVSKRLAKLGSVGYELLIIINNVVNMAMQAMGKGKISLSKRIKDGVKKAVRFMDDFEQTAMDLAIENKYDYVICGHIHKPKIRNYENKDGKVMYLNSGDWIENLTALEYANKKWSLYHYDAEEFTNANLSLPSVEARDLKEVIFA